MCSKEQPIRDLDIAFRDKRILRFTDYSSSMINSQQQLKYEPCTDVRQNKMSEQIFDYQMASYQFQNEGNRQGIVSDMIEASNRLMRKPETSCIVL